MTIFDIRTDIVEPTTRIVFSDRLVEGTHVAHFIESFSRRDDAIAIQDGTGEKVVLVSEEHARNLIKALEKAIQLGWLK